MRSSSSRRTVSTSKKRNKFSSCSPATMVTSSNLGTKSNPFTDPSLCPRSSQLIKHQKLKMKRTSTLFPSLLLDHPLDLLEPLDPLYLLDPLDLLDPLYLIDPLDLLRVPLLSPLKDYPPFFCPQTLFVSSLNSWPTTFLLPFPFGSEA